MVPLQVPTLSEASSSCLLVQWLVEPDSLVDRGDWLAELLTEGVLFSLEAPCSGRLKHLIVAPGEDVSAGQIIAWIDDSLDADASSI